MLVDTAGRLQIDEDMMGELTRLKAAVKPHEILLVADGMTGQDAVRIAQGFHQALGITGVILTKMDGDARGGAALSIYGVTRAPIKYVGIGEKLDALEPFHPERMAGRILQQGDVLTLVEKAQDSGRRGRGQEAGEEGDVEEGPGPPGLPQRHEADAEAGAAQERAGHAAGGESRQMLKAAKRGRQEAQARRSDRALDDQARSGPIPT